MHGIQDGNTIAEATCDLVEDVRFAISNLLELIKTSPREKKLFSVRFQARRKRRQDELVAAVAAVDRAMMRLQVLISWFLGAWSVFRVPSAPGYSAFMDSAPIAMPQEYLRPCRDMLEEIVRAAPDVVQLPFVFTTRGRWFRLTHFRCPHRRCS